MEVGDKKMASEMAPQASRNGHDKGLHMINVVEGVEKGEPFCTLARNVILCSHYGKHYGSFLKN